MILEENIEKVWAFVWGQCSHGLQEVIMTEQDFDDKEDDFDVIWLLEKLKLASSGIDGRGNKHKILIDSMLKFLNICQNERESNDEFLRRFKTEAQTLSLTGGDHIFYSPTISTAVNKDDPTDEERLSEVEKFKALVLLMRSDQRRFGRLLERLRDCDNGGFDKYPITLAGSYDLMVKEMGNVTTSILNDRSGGGGRGFCGYGRYGCAVQFLQQRENEQSIQPVPGISGRLEPTVTCYNCNRLGHFSYDCPQTESSNGGSGNGRGRGRGGRTGYVNVHVGMFFAQHPEKNLISRSWILLDTCSTNSVTNNLELVNNVTKCTSGTELYA